MDKNFSEQPKNKTKYLSGKENALYYNKLKTPKHLFYINMKTCWNFHQVGVKNG